MTAKEYFETQSLTDATKNVVDVFRQKFSKLDLIKFAEAYHANETKQHKTELLSAGSYDQLEMKQDEKDVLFKILFELRKDVNELKTNLKNY